MLATLRTLLGTVRPLPLTVCSRSTGPLGDDRKVGCGPFLEGSQEGTFFLCSEKGSQALFGVLFCLAPQRELRAEVRVWVCTWSFLSRDFSFSAALFVDPCLLPHSPTLGRRDMIRAGVTAACELSYGSHWPASRSMSRTTTRSCFSSISRPRTSSAPIHAHRPPSAVVEAWRRISTDEEGPKPAQGRPRRRWAPVAAGAGLLTAGLGYFATREDAPTLGGDRWTTVKIKSVTPISPETSWFRLEVPKSVLPPAFSSDPTARPILSLYVKEPSLQIQRAYTVSSFFPPAFQPSHPSLIPPGPISRAATLGNFFRFERPGGARPRRQAIS